MSNSITVPLLQHQLRLHDAVLYGDYRFHALISGLGGGKTFIGAYLTLKMIDLYSCPGCIISKDYTTLNDSTLQGARKCFDMLGVDYKISLSGNKKYITINGVTVFLRSLNYPGQIAGLPDIGFIWIDEACKETREEGFRASLGRLRKAITKTTEESVKKWPMKLWVTSTPNGYDHIYRFFKKDVDDEPKRAKKRLLISNIDSSKNIFLDSDYIQSLDDDYSGRYKRQQKGGAFVLMEGSVWEPYISSPVFFMSGDKILFGFPIELAIDFGFRRPAVLMITKLYDKIQEKMIDFVFDAVLEENVITSKLIELTKNRLTNFWGIEKPESIVKEIYCDPAGDSSNTREYLTDIKEFRNAFPAASVYYSQQVEFSSIEKGIIAVDNMFGKKNLAISSDLNIIRKGEYTDVVTAISSVVYPELKPNTPIKNAYVKDGVFDHPADALRYRCVLKQFYVKKGVMK